MSFITKSINELINVSYDCSCGQKHIAQIENIVIGENAVSKLDELISKQKLNDGSIFDKSANKILVVNDINTKYLSDKYVAPILNKANYNFSEFTFQHSEFHAEIQYVQEMKSALTDDISLIITVGSGSLNDMTRYVAFEQKVPYYIVATAPSMDGYASNVSPIVYNNLKTTYICKCADAIIGDVEILATAPMKMIAAGLGDILGKYLAISDWKMSNIINGEFYCDEVGELVLFSVQKCVDTIDGLKKRDLKAIEYLMESLVLIGIAMSFIGFSRPASSSEHHIAHFVEMKSIFKHEFGELHGTNVGMATVLIGQMYEKFLSMDINFEETRNKAKEFDRDAWSKNIKNAYSIAADEVLDLYEKNRQNDSENVIKRIDAIEANKDAVYDLIKNVVISTKKAPDYLLSLDGTISPKDYTLTKAEMKDILLYAKDLRNRYAALQLFYDLGVLEQLADYIVDKHM